jgi:hypothetical protein
MAVIAKIGIYGDIHLNSKNYGAHRNYAKESLEYFHKITEVVQNNGINYLIGCGDFSFGRFSSLEYRLAVEKELEQQYKLTGGQRFELFGNHDMAGYGATERDFYIAKGLLKPSQNLSIGNLNITMVDYGKHLETEPLIVDDAQHVNFVIAHDFYKFSNSNIANFGKAIELDNFEKWFGIDGLICGHVHKIMQFKGYIQKNGLVHEVQVYYPGCMTRPSYREGYMDEKGQIIMLTVNDTGELGFEIIEIPLWSLEDSFNLDEKQIEKEKKQQKEERIDISDVVKQLDMHDRNVGNPEDIIRDMKEIDEKYKNKAIDLLKQALG